MVDFNEDKEVEFIELANSKLFKATHKGMDLHKSKAIADPNWVGKHDSHAKVTEADHSFTLRRFSLAFGKVLHRKTSGTKMACILEQSALRQIAILNSRFTHNKALLQGTPLKTAITAIQGTRSFVARPKVDHYKPLKY